MVVKPALEVAMFDRPGVFGLLTRHITVFLLVFSMKTYDMGHVIKYSVSKQVSELFTCCL